MHGMENFKLAVHVVCSVPSGITQCISSDIMQDC